MGVFFLCISLINHKMKVTLFFVLIAALAVLGQGDFDLVERIVLDDFTNGAILTVFLLHYLLILVLMIQIELKLKCLMQVQDVLVFSDVNVICLTIFIGLQGRTFSSDIFTTPATYYFDGEWAVSNPKNSESEFILQYDGRDNSFSL